jgi:hypothetical protein
MFKPEQISKLSETISAMWLLINAQPLSEAAIDIFIDDVSGIPFESVMLAMLTARRQCKSRISIGDLMKQLQNMDGRPSAEEAWSIASQVMNEAVTVIWTTEIAEAWQVAFPLVEMGDKFSAARAFKEKYESAVLIARSERRTAHWIANIGDDQGLRQLAIEQATNERKLSPEYAMQLLPSYKPVADGVYAAIDSKVTGLIENKIAIIAPLDRVAEIKTAAEKHNERIAGLKKAAGVADERPDRTKCKRDSLAIFEQAESMGIFADNAESKLWAAKAASGDDMRELQIRILSRGTP